MTRLLPVAAALVVVLAAAGVVSGAEWDVYPGAGTPIQDAVDGVGDGDTIYVHDAPTARESGFGDLDGVRTTDTKVFM